MEITPEMLVELINSTIAARKTTEKEMGELRLKLEALETTWNDLQQEEQGYRLALARRFPDAAELMAEPRPSADTGLFTLADDFPAQSRTDAVETAVRILTSNAPAASPADIEQFLNERGRSDTRDAIGAALAYLNRTNRVIRLGRGQWRLAGIK